MSGPRDPRRHVRFERKGVEPAAVGRGPTPSSSASSPASVPTPGTPRKPEFKVSEAPRAGSRAWLVMGGVAALVLCVVAAMNWNRRPDPHFVKAEDMVRRYEVGRAALERNYNNPVYQQALDELDQVDPESISVEPADALRRTILQGREAFETRRREAVQSRGSARAQRTERVDANRESYARARANPQVEYPECDEEGHDAGAHND